MIQIEPYEIMRMLHFIKKIKFHRDTRLRNCQNCGAIQPCFISHEVDEAIEEIEKHLNEMTSQETVNASQLPKHEVAMAIHHLSENNGDKEGDDIDILAALAWLREAQEIMTPELQNYRKEK